MVQRLILIQSSARPPRTPFRDTTKQQEREKLKPKERKEEGGKREKAGRSDARGTTGCTPHLP